MKLSMKTSAFVSVLLTGIGGIACGNSGMSEEAEDAHDAKMEAEEAEAEAEEEEAEAEEEAYDEME